MGQLAELTHVVRELCLELEAGTTALSYAAAAAANSRRAGHAVCGRMVGKNGGSLGTHVGREV